MEGWLFMLLDVEKTCNLLFSKTFFFCDWRGSLIIPPLKWPQLYYLVLKIKPTPRYCARLRPCINVSVMKTGPSNMPPKINSNPDKKIPHNRTLRRLSFFPVATVLWHKNKFDKDASRHFVHNVSLLLYILYKRQFSYKKKKKLHFN